MFGKKKNTASEIRYCFFDIDGVLNTSSDWRRELYCLRDDLVENFCIFCKRNNLIPVIASSWRLGFEGSFDPKNSPQIKRLEKKLSNYGLALKYKTPVLKGKSRDYEIERFLYYHPCDEYIIIDDDESEYRNKMPQNYFVSSEKGFREEDVKEAEKYIKE